VRTTVSAAALLALSACTPIAQPGVGSSCTAPLQAALQFDLYFGLATKDRQIGEAEWSAFLSVDVTPRFPAGLSVIDVAGQYHDPKGRITREPSKLLVVIVLDGSGHLPKVQAIVESYKKRFNQVSVLHVERTICAGF
jgi:hypothetical protein